MELKDLIYEILVEEVRNKKLFDSVFTKWKSEDETLTPEVAEKIFIRFMGGKNEEGKQVRPLKQELSTKKQQVRNFLTKYSGEYGRPKFEPTDLPDITKYSFEQIKTLFSQYGEPIQTKDVEEKVLFFKDPSITERERLEISKQLWFGDQYKIFDDGKGFRIYKPTSQNESISFGFYQKSIAQLHNRSNKWCVTNLRGTDSLSNQWEHYRSNRNRTFYFVIDETKDENDEFYISALQRTSDSSEIRQGYQFRITNAPNSNNDELIKISDPENPERTLVRIYPQLFQNTEVDPLELLPSVEFNERAEMDYTNKSKRERLIDQITEEPGEYDFVIQDPQVKLAYINLGKFLYKVRSFESLIDSDIRTYFDKHLADGNPYEVFQTYDIFDYLVKKRGKSISDYIKEKLSRSGVSVNEIYTHFIEKNHEPGFYSKQDKKIMTYTSKTTGKMGIFNSYVGDWLVHDKIKYVPEYEEIDLDHGSFDFDRTNTSDTKTQDQEVDRDIDQEVGVDGDEMGQENLQEQVDGQISYVLTTWSKSNNPDDPTNFYILNNAEDGTADVSILSHNTWKSVGEPAFVSYGDDDYDFDKGYGDIDTKFDKHLNEKRGQ